MYQKIMDITEHLFQDIEMTEEAQALKEELTADLNERFADLLASGITEDEAVEQINADLADFGELTKRFPHRQRTIMPVAQDVIPINEVTEIRVSLGGDDLSVIPSEDQQLHLELTGDPNAHWHSELNNGCLALKIEREDSVEQEFQNSDNLSSWLLRTLNIIATRVVQQSSQGTLRVPAAWCKTMEINTGSGDVSIELPLETLKINTGSGDVDAHLFDCCRQAKILTASGDANISGTAESISISTASGDIDMHGVTKTLNVSTVSGDADLTRVKTELLDFKTTSGDISFEGEAHKVGFRTVSGDIHLTLTGLITEIRGTSVSGDMIIRLADGQPAVTKANTTSGDVQISSQNGPAPAIITLKSVSGDISVA